MRSSFVKVFKVFVENNDSDSKDSLVLKEIKNQEMYRWLLNNHAVIKITNAKICKK